MANLQNKKEFSMTSPKAAIGPKDKDRISLLCVFCMNIFRGLKHDRHRGSFIQTGITHLRSLEALHDGIKNGCAVCTRLAGHLASKLGGLQDLEPFWSKYKLYDHDRPGKIEFVMSWGADNEEVLQLSLMPLSPVTNLNQLCQATNSGGLDSAATIQLMQGWLRNCLAGHRQCSQRWKETQEFQLPTRLLAVGSPGSKECRVVRTDSGLISEAYLSLSHRWGLSQFLQLNTQTIGTLTAGIPIAELPATFRDAVFIAHQLGIRYLWIDSLCIQQDSKEDWIREAPTMRHVYGFATVNIVAGHSHGPEDGLFNSRVSLPFCPFSVRSDWDNSSNADYLVWDPAAFEDDFEFAPLTQRGWVFQERLLAPRILQFGKKQVYWRCSKLFASEIWPHGAFSVEGETVRFGTDLDELDGNATMDIQPLGELGDPCTTALSRGPVAKWERLVSQYSRTELTYSEDKLVALSGVARLFQQTFRDRYLAGLWWSPLARLLCWRRDNYREREPRARPKQHAPSWSWASIDGPIYFTTASMEYGSISDPRRIEYLVTGVDAMVDTLAGYEMAHVEKGAITVRGGLHSFKILSQEDTTVTLELNGATGTINTKGRLVIDAILDYELHNLQLWIMPTLVSVHEVMNAAMSMVEGLVLRRRSEIGAESDTYERIGYLHASPAAIDEGEKSFGLYFQKSHEGAQAEDSSTATTQTHYKVEFVSRRPCQTVTIV